MLSEKNIQLLTKHWLIEIVYDYKCVLNKSQELQLELFVELDVIIEHTIIDVSFEWTGQARPCYFSLKTVSWLEGSVSHPSSNCMRLIMNILKINFLIFLLLQIKDILHNALVLGANLGKALSRLNLASN